MGLSTAAPHCDFASAARGPSLGAEDGEIRAAAIRPSSTRDDARDLPSVRLFMAAFTAGRVRIDQNINSEFTSIETDSTCPPATARAYAIDLGVMRKEVTFHVLRGHEYLVNILIILHWTSL